MTDAELGFYHRCLNASWINDGLPDELPALARTMRVSLPYLTRIWATVGKRFEMSEITGRLINRRQEEERTYARTKSDRASSAVRTRYERSTDELPRARTRPASASVSESISESSEEQNQNSERAREADVGGPAVDMLTIDAQAVEEFSPIVILPQLRALYIRGGKPVPDKQEQVLIQYISDIQPPRRRVRLVDYVKWAFVTGTWPDPAHTKSLLNLLRDGDWDVDITPRTLPAVVRNAAPSERGQAIAARNFLAKRGVAT